jgi:hypothetical protein
VKEGEAWKPFCIRNRCGELALVSTYNLQGVGLSGLALFFAPREGEPVSWSRSVLTSRQSLLDMSASVATSVSGRCSLSTAAWSIDC